MLNTQGRETRAFHPRTSGSAKPRLSGEGRNPEALRKGTQPIGNVSGFRPSPERRGLGHPSFSFPHAVFTVKLKGNEGEGRAGCLPMALMVDAAVSRDCSRSWAGRSVGGRGFGLEDLVGFPGIGGAVEADYRQETAVGTVGPVRFQVSGARPGVVEADRLPVS